MNWDIALMLSPWGFFHNLILESNHYLAPYYEHSVARGSLLKDPVFALILTGIIALAFWGLKKVARHEA